MTNHRTLLTTAALAAILASRAASADPSPQATVEEMSYDHAPVTLWLAPHAGSGRVRTNFALTLGASGYARLDGLDLGLGASWITEAMRGAQVTVGVNHAGADAEGVQLAVGANLTGQRMTGLQTAVGFNYAGADLRGAQISVGANVTQEHVSGLQLTTGVNYGPAIQGAQIGIVNIGGQVDGAQIGLVNIAGGVKGAQIGLVNVADDSSAPVGLLNVIKNGQHHLDLWSSDSAPVNLGVKLGGRHVYTVLTAGFEASDGKQRWLAGLGIGGHVPIADRFYLEPELITWHVNEGWTLTTDTNSLSSLRLIGGYRVHRDLSVFAGPTLNLLVTRVGDGEGFGLIRGTRLTSEGSDTTVRAWPGFVAGFQILMCY